MQAVFIEHGIAMGKANTPGISGGDVLIINLARRWKARGLDVHFMTTRAGVEVCRSLGLDAVFHELPGQYMHTPSSYVVNAYRNLIQLPPELAHHAPDILVTSNEFFYNVFPAYKLKRIHRPGITWASILHFVPQYPWDRPRSGVREATLGFVNHYLGARIAGRWADAFFAVSQQTERDYTEKMHFPAERFHTIPSGIDYAVARDAAIRSGTKKYHGLFLGRLSPPKGIRDLIPIWRNVMKKDPDARLAVVGTGTDEAIRDFKSKIISEHLERNIEFLGPIYDPRHKYEIIAQSRVLLLPSYDENWAMVVGEALACEVPVVAYDLQKLRQVWGPYVRYTKIGAPKEFAEEVLGVLDLSSAQKTTVFPAALDFVSAFDWGRIADDVLRVVAPNIPLPQRP